MFRIRKISDALIPANQNALHQVFDIIRKHFAEVREEKIQDIANQLTDPLKHKFSSIMIVAEDGRLNVRGFALVLYMPDKHFCFLDYLAVKPGRTSSGTGGALYERAREEARMLNTLGLFMECLPDDPGLCRNQQYIEQNKARLAFYEQYGARPITGTAYETPVNAGDDCPPYLVLDSLDREVSISAKQLKSIVRVILERKYPEYCPESYITMVENSITDDPVRLREFRYRKKQVPFDKRNHQIKEKIALVINDRHIIHHVREVGYLEAPVRIISILKEIEKTGVFNPVRVNNYSESHITGIHSRKYVEYFKKVCEKMPEGKSVYPYVFPLRNASRPPADLSVLAGYYCMDTFTPLNKNAFLAARRAVNCALTGADLLLAGHNAVYALIRPPGHHAETNVFGGFCYFNSAAIAANYLSRYGRIAILDIDYHHGNGQQQIFYRRNDVLTISIHGHPSFAYPYFSGFADERGEGEGLNFNLNYPLKENITGDDYRQVLISALKAIKKYHPVYLIVCLGLDTAKGDPTGTWKLSAGDFRKNGEIIGEMPCQTLFIQEGGYRNRSLGINARNFFEGFWKTKFNKKK
ncbi:MAG: histone deacetylase family protein [Bacteroidales bacterium]|nr:histone deacetylase family protein [Bacteroidales bacterium]